MYSQIITSSNPNTLTTDTEVDLADMRNQRLGILSEKVFAIEGFLGQMCGYLRKGELAKVVGVSSGFFNAAIRQLYRDCTYLVLQNLESKVESPERQTQYRNSVKELFLLDRTERKPFDLPLLLALHPRLSMIVAILDFEAFHMIELTITRLQRQANPVICIRSTQPWTSGWKPLRTEYFIRSNIILPDDWTCQFVYELLVEDDGSCTADDLTWRLRRGQIFQSELSSLRVLHAPNLSRWTIALSAIQEPSNSSNILHAPESIGIQLESAFDVDELSLFLSVLKTIGNRGHVERIHITSPCSTVEISQLLDCAEKLRDNTSELRFLSLPINCRFDSIPSWDRSTQWRVPSELKRVTLILCAHSETAEPVEDLFDPLNTARAVVELFGSDCELLLDDTQFPADIRTETAMCMQEWRRLTGRKN